jgi:hypothetical protein
MTDNSKNAGFMNWLIHRYGASYIIGTAGLIAGLLEYVFIGLLLYHFLLVSSAMQFLKWDGTGLRKALKLSALGFFAIGGFYVLASIIFASFYLRIDDAKGQRVYFESHREEVADAVDHFLESENLGLVQVSKVPLNEAIDYKDNPISNFAKGVFAEYLGSYRWTLPNNLGRDPITPLASGLMSSSLIFMIDAEAQALASEEYKETIGKTSSLPRDMNIFGYLCTMGAKGDVLHLMVMEENIILPDLTQEPEFEPIVRACEEYNELDNMPTREDLEKIRIKARKHLGLPEEPAEKSSDLELLEYN